MLERGHSHDFLMTLDFLSFRALCESSERMAAAEKIERSYLTMMASQGTHKGLKDLLKPYNETLGNSRAGVGDENDFLAKYGGGI